MSLFDCQSCGAQLREDVLTTALSYDNDVNILIDSNGEVDYKAIPQYFSFVCHRCGLTKNISLVELFKLKQRMVVEVLLRMRVNKGMESVKCFPVAEIFIFIILDIFSVPQFF